ncbi:MAG: hypothetical protein IKI97_13490 [Clostridia bacterium]|nr:hypothetical protein [Clostridia bacterium]
MIRLFKGRVCVSVFALMLVLIILFSVDSVFFIVAILGALLHEVAHLIAMKLCGAKIIRISIYPFGADIKADTLGLTYKEEIAVALAGPLMSLFASAVAFLFLHFGTYIYVLAFAVSNFLFFAVNILPVRGLDGGRVLFSALMIKFDVADAYRIYDYISTFAFGLLCFLSLFLLWLSGYNLSLLFICCYLFISEYARQKLCYG